MKHLLSFLTLMLITLPACSLLDPHEGGVTARARSGEVLISNHGSERVYYFVVGREAAAWINWAQHLNPEFSVAPRDRRGISYDDIYQEEGGEEEALVYWWHAEQQGETEIPGELNSIVVDL